MKTKFKVGDKIRLKEKDREEFLSFISDDSVSARSVFGDNLDGEATITGFDDDNNNGWTLAYFHNDTSLAFFCNRLELVDAAIPPIFLFGVKPGQNMTTKFQHGQIVRCVRDEDHQDEIKVGQLYEVYRDSGKYVEIRGKHRIYLKNRFSSTLCDFDEALFKI